MKVWLFCLLFSGSAWLSFGQLQLSPAAKISVITCGPDHRELYAAFGHSAIRVYDPAHGLDEAFNFGVFNFNQPNFYLNFAKGFLYYKLGVYSYPDFEAYYLANDRYVHEQVLNLSADQKERVFQFLIWNARPENQNYRYQYYQNNCASKIRDVLQSQLAGFIRWDSSFLKAGHSFRQKTDEYLAQLPWGDLGIDICLGLPIDRPMTAWEYMFLPDYIEQFVDHAVIKTDAAWVPLVAEKRLLSRPPIQPAVQVIHPWAAAGGILLAAILLTVWDWKRKKLSKWFDVMVFGSAGLIGWVLFALWMFTDHTDAAKNFNLLWAFPFHAVAVWGLLRSERSLRTRRYFLITAGGLFMLLIFWWAVPQALNVFLLPVVAAMAVRALLISQMRSYQLR